METDLKYREFLSRIFKQQYSGLYNYGLKISGSHDITKDAIQELFLQLWRNREKLDSIAKVDSYIYRSLRNNLLRDIKSVNDATVNGSDNPDFEFSHEEFLISEELSSEKGKMVSQSVNKLPPRQKEIIFLRFYNDLSYKEIGEVLGIAYKTVKNLTYEALNKMRIELNA
jgi:RNA polymerase sigma factor (sigma-70 family)